MDPLYIANENTVENCTLKFSKLVEKLMYLKRINSNVGDDATEQFMKMISELVPKYKDKFLEFNKYEHRLHTFQPPNSWKREVWNKTSDHVGGTMVAKILNFRFSKILKNIFPGHFAVSHCP